MHDIKSRGIQLVEYNYKNNRCMKTSTCITLVTFVLDNEKYISRQ